MDDKAHPLSLFDLSLQLLYDMGSLRCIGVFLGTYAGAWSFSRGVLCDFCELTFSWKLATLPVRRGAFILLWGEALRPPPNPPSRFFIFNSKARKYISWGWHDDVVNMMAWMLTMTIVRNLHLCELTFSWKLTALHVRRDACILLWGEFTSLSITLFIFSGKLTGLHVRRDACILLWGEALRPPPNPPLPLFYS